MAFLGFGTLNFRRFHFRPQFNMDRFKPIALSKKKKRKNPNFLWHHSCIIPDHQSHVGLPKKVLGASLKSSE